MSLRPLAASALALGLLLALAAAPPERAAEPAQPVAAEINERFLDPDLDVESWQQRFETESREIYTARHAIVAALGLRPGDAVADVGAGTGLFLALFAEAVGSDGRVYAVEISPRFLEHLRARSEREGLAPVRVVEGSERSPELPAGSLDVAFLCDTYHHFTHPRAMLEGLHRALEPGGRLAVVDFERIPGESRNWILEHVRADRETVRREIEAVGFVFEARAEVEGLVENYVLLFRRPPEPPAPVATPR